MDISPGDPPTMPEGEWDLLHYATGLLMGIANRRGRMDVSIYHNKIHVRIEWVERDMIEGDL